MAKTLYTIQMDFKKANDCAAKLEEAARKLKQCAQENFQDEIRKLESSWKGENAALYISKCDSITHKMESTAKKMVQTANTVRTVARNTYNADMRARNIALTKGKNGR